MLFLAFRFVFGENSYFCLPLAIYTPRGHLIPDVPVFYLHIFWWNKHWLRELQCHARMHAPLFWPHLNCQCHKVCLITVIEKLRVMLVCEFHWQEIDMRKPLENKAKSLCNTKYTGCGPNSRGCFCLLLFV